MEKMEFGNRRRLLKEIRRLDGCEINYCAFYGVCRDAEPRTECCRMSFGFVMRMLRHVGGELRVHNPAERHKPEREPSDCKLLNPTVHRHLSRSCCLYRPCF